jgi:hypothetical protein
MLSAREPLSERRAAKEPQEEWDKLIVRRIREILRGNEKQEQTSILKGMCMFSHMKMKNMNNRTPWVN